jgi:spore photoproduct lyase
MMPDPAIKRVLMEEGTSRHALTQRILRRLSDTPVQLTTGNGSCERAGETDLGKGTLHLLNYKGDFLKPCPGTKKYICCGYQILNLSTNCPLDCSYCILQSYFNQPNLRIFVNLQEKLAQVLETIDSNPDKIFRIGTGEFTDSLALDHITGLGEILLPVFSKRKNAVLELKTKTGRIKGLLASKHRDRIIVSWSLNSPYISAQEEHGAASLKKRLEAARLCQTDGFALGFHFDPLVYHDNWREEYLKTIELMTNYIDPRGIIWMSLGSFRFMPELRRIIRRRHPETCILNGEFIVGLDGKMRYFKPMRIELYSYIREKLEKWHPNLGL